MRIVILFFSIMLGTVGLAAYGQEEAAPRKEVEKSKPVEEAKEISEKTKEKAPDIKPEIIAEIEDICMVGYNHCANQCESSLEVGKSLLENLIESFGSREEFEKSEPELLAEAEAELAYQFNACLDDCKDNYNDCVELGISLAPTG